MAKAERTRYVQDCRNLCAGVEARNCGSHAIPLKHFCLWRRQQSEKPCLEGPKARNRLGQETYRWVWRRPCEGSLSKVGSALTNEQENITVAGESAGAVYAHAHVVENAPVKRAILMSGTLEMSPPRPLSNEAAIVAPIEAKLARIGSSLRTATAEQIIEALTEANVVSMWLQQSPDEPELSEWTRTGNASSLLIGDVEYEVRLRENWRVATLTHRSRFFGETASRH